MYVMTSKYETSPNMKRSLKKRRQMKKWMEEEGLFQENEAKKYISLKKDKEGFIVKTVNKEIGKGLFAAKDFVKGEFLTEYCGELISKEEGERREKSYPLRFGSFLYFFQSKGKECCIDATFTERIGRYINDGTGRTQNAVTKLQYVENKPHLCLYAKKHIAAGEEIRYDYGVYNLTWRKKKFMSKTGTFLKPPVAGYKTKSSLKSISGQKSPDCVREEKICKRNLRCNILKKKCKLMCCLSPENRKGRPVYKKWTKGKGWHSTHYQTKTSVAGTNQRTYLAENPTANRGDVVQKRNLCTTRKNPSQRNDQMNAKYQTHINDHEVPKYHKVKPCSVKLTRLLLTSETTVKATNHGTYLAENSEKREDVIQKFNLWPIRKCSSKRNDKIIPCSVKLNRLIHTPEKEVKIINNGTNLKDRGDIVQRINICGTRISSSQSNDQTHIEYQNDMIDEEVNNSPKVAELENDNSTDTASGNVDAYVQDASTSEPSVKITYNDVYLTKSYAEDRDDIVKRINTCDIRIGSFEGNDQTHVDYQTDMIDQEVNNRQKVVEMENDNNRENASENVHAFTQAVSPSGKISKKPKRPCLFCGKMQSKLTLHLQRKHRFKDKVKEALKLPKCLRDNAFNCLRKDGIFMMNKRILMRQDLKDSEKKNQLIKERKHGKKTTIMCSFCHGFYSSRVIHRHKSSCSAANLEATNFPVSIPISLAFENNGSKEYEEKILAKFRSDEVGELCRTDPFIQILGLHNFPKIKTRLEKRGVLKDTLMAEMRRMGSLFKEFKLLAKQDKKKITTCFEMFDRSHFEYLKEAIQKVTTADDGSVKFGLKSGIGFLLKKAAKILKGHYLLQKQDKKAAEVDNFTTLLSYFWTSIFSDAEYANVKARQIDLRKPKKLPKEDDVKKLRTFNVEEIKKIEDPYVFLTSTEFRYLRDLLVCRLTLFNARRGGEPSRLLLKEWHDAEEGTWISEESVQTIYDPIEKQILGKYRIAYQAGKNLNQMVPLLIPSDCLQGMRKLASKEMREAASICTDNPFMFPNISYSERHVKGWHSVESICSKAGLSQTINATSMRHRASTLYAALDIPDNERQIFYRHMGHSESINRDVYQCPMAIQEIVKVGKFLGNLDRQNENSSDDFPHGEENIFQEKMSVPSQNLNPVGGCEVKMKLRKDEKEGKKEESDEEYTPSEKTDDEDEVSNEEFYGDDPLMTKKAPRPYKLWSPEDTNEVRNFFSSYVEDTSSFDRKGSLPAKETVDVFIEKNPNIFPDLCHKKKVTLIKAKIFNERNKTRRLLERQLKSLTV